MLRIFRVNIFIHKSFFSVLLISDMGIDFCVFTDE